MAAAVTRSGSSSPSTIASSERRPAWVETFTAAITFPSASRTGTASDRRPSSSSWSTSDQPCSAILLSSARSAMGLVMVCSVRLSSDTADK